MDSVPRGVFLLRYGSAALGKSCCGLQDTSCSSSKPNTDCASLLGVQPMDLRLELSLSLPRVTTSNVSRETL